jgi:hypothetical protein
MVQLLSILGIALTSIAATSGGHKWEADYGKALAATRADDRPLLVVLQVPGESQVADDSEQAKLLGDYQLCRIDASTEYGQRVAEAFKAESLPYMAIIDKTGSVVLFHKEGQLSEEEWQSTLAAHRKGERLSRTYHTSAYRGMLEDGVSTSVSNPSYCPSCQRRSQSQAH